LNIPAPRFWLYALASLTAASIPVVRGTGTQTTPAAAGHPTQPVITDIGQFWSLSLEQKSRPVAFRIDCSVTFFDPIWRILFVQDTQGVGAYVPFKSLKFPFKAGQQIVAEGQLLPPIVDLSFDHADIAPEGPSNLAPKPMAGGLAQWERLKTTLVSAEGLVDRCSRTDSAHMQLALSVEGQTVIAWVLMDPATPTPELADMVVRLEGVYNPRSGLDGKLSEADIMVPGLDRLRVVGPLADDPRFKLPIVPIASLSRLPTNRVVRISGQVKAQDPGHYLRIRDGSGQVDVMTGQLRLCAVDETVEAVGLPAIAGTRWLLNNGLFRVSAARAPAASPQTSTDTLHLTAQVLELAADQAALGRPVSLTGVVTWSLRNTPFFFIQDSSGGIRVMRDDSSLTFIEPGRNVEVAGVTGMGSFAPIVRASRVERTSDLLVPVAAPVSLEHALTGVEEANWVEMRGYVRSVEPSEGLNNMEIVTPTGDFVAAVPAGRDTSALVGAIIRARGVCTADTNSQRKLTGIKLWVPSADYVEVEQRPPKDPFDLPVRQLSSLGQFNSAQSFNRLLRVSGVVLDQSPGRYIFIEDGGPSLLMYSREKAPLRPGDRIDAVGLLARQGGRVTLREAAYRITGHPGQPTPVPMSPQYLPSAEFDGRLVRVKGTLIGFSQMENGFRLTLQRDNVIFEAFLDRASWGGIPQGVSNGSLLSLTGVYEVNYDEYGSPLSYQIDLRAPDDVAVLRRPPWLTRGRILAVTAMFGAGIILFIAWVAALHRLVRKQIQEIREKAKRESQLEAELQRVGKLESLGLLAGGIAHDFNNLLTAVMGNLSLALLDPQMQPDSAGLLLDAQKAADRAKDLTQQLLTFARGGAPIREAVSLSEVVAEVAEFALHGSKVRCLYDFPGDLWPADVDKGQISQVVQNLVINAMQSMPGGGMIDIAMRNETVGEGLGQVLAPGRYLHLTVTDHGEGIPPRNLDKIFDPYFTTKERGNGLGLATVHSIIKKHMGHISVESALDRGTAFHIWLPAAHGAPMSRTTLEALRMPPDHATPDRILFMDDEPLIRQTAGAILRHLGYDVRLVSDGVEAVEEYSAALRAGRSFSLVILDLTIPGGMGGAQTLEELQKLDPSVKAIVSSGYSKDAVLSNFRAHGYRGMVSKPYDAEGLARAVARVLKGDGT
jgi:signal transduction histidine kinase/ActR/RegA family two-component response regulator